MKTMKMISRRSFLKAAMAAATVSALGLTGCGSSASSTASGTASGAAASSAAASEAGQTFKVGIVNYVDHASLNQIVASVEERLDEVGKEKGVTFDYADYYANAQADQTNLNQNAVGHEVGADLVQVGLVSLCICVVVGVVEGNALLCPQLIQTALHRFHDLVEGSMIHIVDDANLEGLATLGCCGSGSGRSGGRCSHGAGSGAAAADECQCRNGGSNHSGLEEAAAGDHGNVFHNSKLLSRSGRQK